MNILKQKRNEVKKGESMPCTFDIKPEDRHCQYCSVVFCDERQPKKIETLATNKIE